MKITRFSTKEFSWLQFPVTVKGCNKPSLHITAKYFGRVPLNVDALTTFVDGIANYRITGKLEWEPVKFGELIHVLELTKYPMILDFVHERFNIIKDDFEPFKPHITVPVEYWRWVRDKKLTPEMEELKLGRLELCLGTKEVEG